MTYSTEGYDRSAVALGAKAWECLSMQAIMEGCNAEKFGSGNHTLSAASMNSNLKHTSSYGEPITKSSLPDETKLIPLKIQQPNLDRTCLIDRSRINSMCAKSHQALSFSVNIDDMKAEVEAIFDCH